uniref:HDC19877 n=1 Tax=Drosophila melanogaster TaxID=7227 RepID=Q6II35_DROME|nr:TPA_inf: HDC19877 [Drosophila melanogaster]
MKQDLAAGFHLVNDEVEGWCIGWIRIFSVFPLPVSVNTRQDTKTAASRGESQGPLGCARELQPEKYLGDFGWSLCGERERVNRTFCEGSSRLWLYDLRLAGTQSLGYLGYLAHISHPSDMPDLRDVLPKDLASCASPAAGFSFLNPRADPTLNPHVPAHLQVFLESAWLEGNKDPVPAAPNC